MVLPKINIPKTKSVYRMKNAEKGLIGWFVQVRFRNKTYRKFFSDDKYRGVQESYNAAVAWRNAKEDEIGKPRSARTIRPKSTRAGRTGVRYREKKYTRADGSVSVRKVFEVSWCPEPGKSSRTEISIDRWGEKTAYERAVAVREEKERQHYEEPTKKQIGRRRRIEATHV